METNDGAGYDVKRKQLGVFVCIHSQHAVCCVARTLILRNSKTLLVLVTSFRHWDWKTVTLVYAK